MYNLEGDKPGHFSSKLLNALIGKEVKCVEIEMERDNDNFDLLIFPFAANFYFICEKNNIGGTENIYTNEKDLIDEIEAYIKDGTNELVEEITSFELDDR